LIDVIGGEWCQPHEDYYSSERGESAEVVVDSTLSQLRASSGKPDVAVRMTPFTLNGQELKIQFMGISVASTCYTLTLQLATKNTKEEFASLC